MPGRNIDGAVDVLFFINSRRTHIQNQHTVKIKPKIWLNKALANIFNCHTDEVNRIFGSRIRRCIAKLGISQISRCSAKTHNCGNNIYALIHTLFAHGLRAKNFSVFAVENFQDQSFRSRIITGMRIAQDEHFFIRNRGFCEAFFILSGKCRRELKNFNNTSALRTGIRIRMFSGNMVGNQPSLAVGRPRQSNHGLLTRDKIFDSHTVTTGIDIGIVGLHIFIGNNSTFFGQSDTGFFSQFRFRPNPDCQNQHVSRNLFTGGKNNTVTGNTLQTIRKIKRKVIAFHLFMNEGCHIFIKRHQHLWCHLHQRCLNPQMA